MTTKDPWARTWTIVSADMDLAHVMMQLSSFQLQNVNSSAESPEYRVVYNNQPPAPDCFKETALTPVGYHRPTFQEITEVEKTAVEVPFPLAAYSAKTHDHYFHVADSMGRYMNSHREVERLEGTIKIPCHANGGPIHSKALNPHTPYTYLTAVHFYQFENAVEGGLPLLVVRTPLSPSCPRNGDGTAIGFGNR